MCDLEVIGVPSIVKVIRKAEGFGSVCLLLIDKTRDKLKIEDLYMSVSVKDEKLKVFIVYYESIKRELKIKPVYECRCDERLQTKTKRFTLLSYTGLVVEHQKIRRDLCLI